jgi:hypothetical protein
LRRPGVGRRDRMGSTRMRVAWMLALIACLAGAPRARAQAISPADYLPLAEHAEWQLDRVSGSGKSKLRLEVTDVNVTDTGTRYVIDVPVDDVHLGMRLEFATDASLVLRAVTIDLNELLDDLPFDPGATGDLQFQPPVLLGTASVVPGSAVAQTPVDTEFNAELDTDIGDVSVDVQVTGAVTSTWDPATSPTVTPAGSFDDVVTLALDIALRFSEDEFDSDETVEERVGFVLARGVGFVQVQSGDSTYALNRAVVNGVPIGNYAQYEDIVGLSFAVPPVISLDGRARGNASSGDFVLHDIRLSHTLQGKAQLDAVLDHPTATGVPVSVGGPTSAKKDGRLKLDLTGKTVVLDQKVKLHVKQIVDPTSTTLDLTAKIGGTSVVIPIGIEPVVSGDVRISLDGLVDQSTGSGGERTLTSDGRLLLGDVEYPVVAKEKLKTKKDGTRARTYKFKPTGNDTVVVHAEATSTSAADFTVTKIKPTLFKLAVPKSQVTNVVPTVVQP